MKKPVYLSSFLEYPCDYTLSPDSGDKGASALSFGRSAVQILAESYQRLFIWYVLLSLHGVQHLKKDRPLRNNHRLPTDSTGLKGRLASFSCVELSWKRRELGYYYLRGNMYKGTGTSI